MNLAHSHETPRVKTIEQTLADSTVIDWLAVGVGQRHNTQPTNPTNLNFLCEDFAFAFIALGAARCVCVCFYLTFPSVCCCFLSFAYRPLEFYNSSNIEDKNKVYFSSPLFLRLLFVQWRPFLKISCNFFLFPKRIRQFGF